MVWNIANVRKITKDKFRWEFDMPGLTCSRSMLILEIHHVMTIGLRRIPAHRKNPMSGLKESNIKLFARDEW